MASRGLKEVPPPGTRVQLTGYFLKATGQQRGGEGSKKWKVVACSCPLCSRGDFVAVDEPTSEEELRTTYADIPKADRAKHGILWRHINKANLQLVGKLPHSRDMADAPELVAGKKLGTHHVSKKTSAQLDREIAQALSNQPGNPARESAIAKARAEAMRSNRRQSLWVTRDGEFRVRPMGEKVSPLWSFERHIPSEELHRR